MLNTVKKEENLSIGFSETKWAELIEKMGMLYNLDSTAKAKMLNHKVTKMIAAIPFIANSNNPERTAMSHLSIYFLAASKAGKMTFVHKESDNDDILKRLESISNFDGGDETIIAKGMNLLALTMIEDYYRDMSDDKEKNKYNPFVSGAWNYLMIKNELVERASSYKITELDDIIDIHEVQNTYWELV